MTYNFDEKSKIALDAMEEYAARVGTPGVAVFAYAEDENVKTWKFAMRIIDSFNSIYEDGTGDNFISIAFSKVAESIETGKNSGNHSRPLINGEFGYKGSAIAKIESGVIIASFSGSTGDIDVQIAEYGLSKVVDTI